MSRSREKQLYQAEIDALERERALIRAQAAALNDEKRHHHHDELDDRRMPLVTPASRISHLASRGTPLAVKYHMIELFTMLYATFTSRRQA